MKPLISVIATALVSTVAIGGAAVGATHGTAAHQGGTSSVELRHASATPAKTRVVIKVKGCATCKVTAHSYRLVDGQEKVWTSKTKKVGKDGRLALSVPTRLTRGMSLAIKAPWERRTGAAGFVVFRYAGQKIGSPVTTKESARARRGNACFAGTDTRRLVLKLKVRRAHFDGNGGRATGAAAYLTRTAKTEGLFERTYDGFWGTQDTAPCYRN